MTENFGKALQCGAFLLSPCLFRYALDVDHLRAALGPLKAVPTQGAMIYCRDENFCAFRGSNF